jgi:hypothetical protein
MAMRLCSVIIFIMISGIIPKAHATPSPSVSEDAFERGRGDYSQVWDTHQNYRFCKERDTPLERVDCSARPWRKPQ